jgi:hypothetical protein
MDGPKTLMEFMKMHKTEEDCRRMYPSKSRLLVERARQLGITPQTAWTIRHKTTHAVALQGDKWI